MSISQLQKNAFLRSSEFVEQVNGIVAEQALYKYDTTPNLDNNTSNNLGGVAKNPNQYGFPQIIINDTSWTMTYDQWAADPQAADIEIEGRVQKYWNMVTGIYPPTEASSQLGQPLGK